MGSEIIPIDHVAGRFSDARWTVSISLDIENSRQADLASFLSPDEKVRAAGFQVERDRRRWVACRGLLRAALGWYLDEAPESLRFAYGPRGKPYLNGSRLGFSVSHSGSIALFAFAWNCEVGADIEVFRDDFSPALLAQKFFSPKEQEFLKSVPLSQRHRAFLMLWTEKEALVKADGNGLALPFQSSLLGTASDVSLFRWNTNVDGQDCLAAVVFLPPCRSDCILD